MGRLYSNPNSIKADCDHAPTLSFRSLLNAKEPWDYVGDDDPTQVAPPRRTAANIPRHRPNRRRFDDDSATVCAPVVSERLAYWDSRVNSPGADEREDDRFVLLARWKEWLGSNGGASR
jgi:hypothetical protein